MAEVAQKCPDADVIINVQGDEPLIDPQIIDDLAQEFLNDENLKMATVKTPMKEEEKAKPGNVKVITDKNGYALYFSRSLIPYPREDTGVVVYKHIGIYGYRRDFLLQYAKMQPTPLEQTESLEQLRALENGYKIKVIATDKHFVGVDTKEDLEEVNKIYQEMEKINKLKEGSVAMHTVKIGNFEVGAGNPLVLLAGPCVLESYERSLYIGKTIKEITSRLGIPYVFKASFDKANRSSYNGYRGPGLEKGLKWLQSIKDELNVPVVTDIHNETQVEPVSKVVDVLQIPAFLSRQTDLLYTAAKSGCVVNVKKVNSWLQQI